MAIATTTALLLGAAAVKGVSSIVGAKKSATAATESAKILSDAAAKASQQEIDAINQANDDLKANDAEVQAIYEPYNQMARAGMNNLMAGVGIPMAPQSAAPPMAQPKQKNPMQRRPLGTRWTGQNPAGESEVGGPMTRMRGQQRPAGGRYSYAGPDAVTMVDPKTGEQRQVSPEHVDHYKQFGAQVIGAGA